MNLLRRLLRSIAWLCWLIAVPAAASTEVQERLPSGAYIRIEVPDGWRPGGPLVLFQHGFNLEFDDDPGLGPWRDRLLSEGYAVAASGYRMAGWALFSAVEDNRDLLSAFTQRFGAPGDLISMGGSMGGLIALRLAESPGFERIRGVLSVCPPAAGARSWDTAVDLRMAYDAVCAGVGGGELPRSDGPLPWVFERDQIPNDVGDLLNSGAVIRTLARVTQCTGVTLPPLLRSNGQRSRLARLMAFGKFESEEFFITNIGYATFAMSDLIRDPLKLNGGNPFTTEGVDYGDTNINTATPRFRADAWARQQLHRVSDLTGAIPASTRVVLLHTSRDELVRASHQRFLDENGDYRTVVQGLGEIRQLFRALVREEVSSHCGFSAPELDAAWVTLKQSMNGAQVKTTDFQQACAASQQAGNAGACRVPGEPTITETVDETMRPRPNQLEAETSARNAGIWFDPNLVGEGFYVEPLPDNQAIVSGYSYPALGDGGEQLWWVGIGRIDGNGISVPDIALYRGPRFQNFQTGDLRAQGFGSAELLFTNRSTAEIRLNVPGRYGLPNRTLARLTEHAEYTGPVILPIPNVQSFSLAGIYVAPSRTGEGLILHHMPVQNGNNVQQRDFLIWYTFDNEGDPMWLVGERDQPMGMGPGLGINRYHFSLGRPVGTFYPPNFNPGQIQTQPFGTVELENTNCSQMRVRFDARAGGFGQGEFLADRVTATRNSPCVWD